jgi:hypothetical protein
VRENAQPVSYTDFLTADPRRGGGSALEIGHDFADEDSRRFRVVWYSATGELTFERLEGDTFDALSVEDFAAGIAAVEVVAQLDRDTLEHVLGEWPEVEHCQPRTLARVRERLALA